MSIQRKQIDAIKTEAQRLLQRIDELERCAGWTRPEFRGDGPHPRDIFKTGQYTSAVKRASMDLSRVLVEIRR